MAKSSSKGGSKKASKKTKKTSSKNRKKSSTHQTGESNRFPGLVIALSVVGLIAGIIAIFYLFPSPAPVPRSMRHSLFPFEEGTTPPPPPPSRPRPRVAPSPVVKRPRVAIIIDDLGYDLGLDEAFFHLNAPLTFAFLPYAPYTKRLATQAHRLRHDILVHLPLEPISRTVNPGPGVLLTNMDLETVIRILRKDINAVPWAVGVNNHMGSKFTADKQHMEWVLEEIKQRGLFFVDSRTTAKTVAYATARELGVPAAQRDVFLDHDPSPEAIRHQLKRLVSIARQKGYAIAIGHPFLVTWKVLYRELPRLDKQVKIVPVHELLSH